jgi:hypothetical protein
VSVNEALLRYANHHPSLVNDADLWCIQRQTVPDLGPDDIVLIGASRMQTNIDLPTMERLFNGARVINLAQSGRGTPFPVFRDLVENTSFAGTIMISVTEGMLIDPSDAQQEFVSHFHRRWSMDRSINKAIANCWQSLFVFCNPSSSSYRLWGNLLFQQELPEINHVQTLLTRQQKSDFQDPGVVRRVNKLRASGFSEQENERTTQPISSHEYDSLVAGIWDRTLDQFASRGGRAVMLRMPVSQKIAIADSEQWPIELYWNRVMGVRAVGHIHYQSHSKLAAFEFPDTSHLDYRDSAQFTRLLCRIVKDVIEESPQVRHEYTED